MTSTITLKAEQNFIQRHHEGVVKTGSSVLTAGVGGGLTYGLWLGAEALLAMGGAWSVLGGLLVVIAAFVAYSTLRGIFNIMFVV